MSSLKEVCRLLLRTDLSNRQIGEKLACSPTTVGRYRQRMTEEALVSWEQIEPMDELALDRKLNPNRSRHRKLFVEPDWADVHKELQRRGVTLVLLHEEYALGLESGAMSETEFRRRYRRYARARGLVMRQIHLPGQKLFLDYSGVRPSLTDRVTGKKTPVELFVAVMGASRRTFVYAVHTQRLPDWIACNAKALAFLNGVPTFLVPDNLKAAVTSISREEGALLNMTYAEFAAHYDTVVLPTRPRRPKDKAAVEVGVQIAQRWILARLRNRIFYSLGELNAAIAELTERLNNRPMRTCGGKSRQQLFDELDAPALAPLPVTPYEFADWKLKVTVGQDYHVPCVGRYYSVPYALVGAKVNVKVTRDAVMVFHRERRVALHVRRHEDPGGCSTFAEHQPKAHRAYSQDQSGALIAWAEQLGGAVHRFVLHHIEFHRRPAQSLQACRGLQKLVRDYGPERVQAACDRALRAHANSISSVKSMLQRGMEHTPLVDAPAANDDPMPAHENVRGAPYYT